MTEDFPVHVGDVLLGKYRVERLLGRGGMGIVVAARHLDLGQLFAIKFLHPEAVQNAQAVERFVREARAAAQLKGEHVAKVVDVGRLPNNAPYMVMEHLTGHDLRHVSKQRGPIPADEAALYALHAAEALIEAHAAGIVHRDIKPANLFLIARPNGAPCVKVLDFGISKQLSPDAAELTQTGDLVGSPVYMSPEQMTRSRSVDARTDIWSLGMVLFKLVTGKLPFLGDTLPEIVALVLQEDALLPSAVLPGIPPQMDHIVSRCLRKSPADRYPTMTAFAADLRAFLEQSGSPLWSGAQASALSGSFPSADSLAAQVPLPAPLLSNPPSGASQSGVTGASWGRTGAGPSAPPLRPRKGPWIAAIAVIGIGIVGAGLFAWFGRGPLAGAAPETAPQPTTAVSTETPASSASVPVPSPSGDGTATSSATAASSASATAASSASAKSPTKRFTPPKKHEGIF